MFYRNKKPAIILLIIIIVLITGFINFRLECLYQRNIIETLVRYIQINRLHLINQQMQGNYFILQSIVLSKTWEYEYAMYKDKETTKYLGSNNPNIKLLRKAQQISQRYKINIDSQLLLVPYFYKQDNKGIVMGFIDFDAAGIRVVK